MLPIIALMLFFGSRSNPTSYTAFSFYVLLMFYGLAEYFGFFFPLLGFYDLDTSNKPHPVIYRMFHSLVLLNSGCTFTKKPQEAGEEAW